VAKLKLWALDILKPGADSGGETKEPEKAAAPVA
jgi:hypothetical protein